MKEIICNKGETVQIATQKKLKRSIILNKILEKIAIESKKRDLLK